MNKSSLVKGQGNAEIGVLLAMISAAPSLIKVVKETMDEIGSLPNIPTKVMDGGIMWTTLAKSNGWKLQQNQITKHCRIIDPKKIRRAWGTKDEMRYVLATLTEMNNSGT